MKNGKKIGVYLLDIAYIDNEEVSTGTRDEGAGVFHFGVSGFVTVIAE